MLLRVLIKDCSKTATLRPRCKGAAFSFDCSQAGVAVAAVDEEEEVDMMEKRWREFSRDENGVVVVVVVVAARGRFERQARQSLNLSNYPESLNVGNIQILVYVGCSTKVVCLLTDLSGTGNEKGKVVLLRTSKNEYQYQVIPSACLIFLENLGSQVITSDASIHTTLSQHHTLLFPLIVCTDYFDMISRFSLALRHDVLY